MKIIEFKPIYLEKYPHIKASFALEFASGLITRNFKLKASKKGKPFISLPVQKNFESNDPPYIEIVSVIEDKKHEFIKKILTLLEPYFKDINW